jgi:hypothetical protein
VKVAKRPKADGSWLTDLSNAALPTVMRKIVLHAKERAAIRA